jgi:hypothetical protein
MSSPHPSSAPAIPCRATPRLGIFVALTGTILGLAALAAGSLGYGTLRFAGFALLAIGGATAGALRWRRGREELDREVIRELEAAWERLEQRDHAHALAVATRATTLAKTPRGRNAALTTLAWAALGQGYPERAKAALDRIEPCHALDVYCLAAVESARGRPELAIEALEIARSAGTLTCEGAKLLVDSYAQRCGIERAVLAALQTRDVLGLENCKTVVKAACDAGAHAAAATLTSALGCDTRPLRIIESAHVG